MRCLPARFLACVVWILAPASVVGQPPAPPSAQPAEPVVGQAPAPPRLDGQVVPIRPGEAMGITEIIVARVPPLDLKMAAGLSPDSHPELLTWERVYALALVRARRGHGPLAEALDPKALDDQAARNGVADFARFRKEFLAAKPGADEDFRDPSGDFLALLGRLQMIDHARRNVAFHENMLKLMQELIQGQASGLSQLDVDLVNAALVRARQSWSDESADFRNRLDALKVELGLSPHAPVLPDHQSVVAFSRVSDELEAWSRRPDRILSELPRIIHGQPVLGSVVVEGLPILERIGGGPAPSEDMLTRAARLAIQNRGAVDKGRSPGDADAALELDVRRRVRHLFELRRAYNGEQRSYDLAIRMLDQAFERLVAPSEAIASPRSPMLAGLLGQENQRLNAENRLVTVWTSFQAERLALYRELGILPYADWKSFINELSAR